MIDALLFITVIVCGLILALGAVGLITLGVGAMIARMHPLTCDCWVCEVIKGED